MHSDVYTVQRQSYTVLIKGNKIFCLTLGINFGNYFSKVSNEGEDPSWFYFIYLFNYPPMDDTINC